ncbi:hypothetical protein BGX23_007845 [Mortierella sp. AD031]|nr:hypothetical protein BGX23_007845 [Mortierella sp. AD031]
MNPIRIRTRPLLTLLLNPLHFQVPLKTAAASSVASAKKTKVNNNTTTAAAKGTTKAKSAAKGATNDTSEKTTANQSVSATGLTDVDGTRIRVWLMKSEPDTFSIDDLINSKDSTSHWDGVRNHEAKNLMKNSMKVGDQVLFYQGTGHPMAKIVREAYPDHTALDPKSPYYDEKSSQDDPRWFMVDVKYVRKLKRVLTLKELQQYKHRELSGMTLLSRGRLSIQPVSDSQMSFIMDLEQQAAPSEE